VTDILVVIFGVVLLIAAIFTEPLLMSARSRWGQRLGAALFIFLMLLLLFGVVVNILY
jgi:hypothetical protein